jgi:hypothetical protein
MDTRARGWPGTRIPAAALLLGRADGFTESVVIVEMATAS